MYLQMLWFTDNLEVVDTRDHSLCEHISFEPLGAIRLLPSSSGGRCNLEIRTRSNVFPWNIQDAHRLEAQAVAQSRGRAFDLMRLQETGTCQLKLTRMANISRGEESCHR